VHSLWPPSEAVEVDDAELERIYAYPEPLDAPWVQVNFVSSADGAATVGGRSKGLSSPADQRIFSLGRDLADVILVGAGTVHIEGYGGVERTKSRTERRARLGLSAAAPIAVVTARCSIEPASPLVTDTEVAPIVLTTAAAPERRRAALSQAGVDVIVAGEHTVDLRKSLAALAERGLPRVDCEGGPTLFGSLIAEDLVDQLCLTVSPLLVGGGASRIAHGPPTDATRGLSLASALIEDGVLMLRYRRR
jgi:riboflavin-specific deaminase-like protein